MTNVAIPDRMKNLPLDKRGYPIPVMVLRDTDGRPHFTINNDEERARCIVEDRCTICGERLTRGRWLIGGPLSAFHEHGAYLDPPVHFECGRYALEVCPYLAAPSYARRIDDKTLDPAKMPPGMLGTLDQTMIPERPDIFVFGMVLRTRLNEHGHVIPGRPFRIVEFWRKGQRIPDGEGKAIAQRVLAAQRAKEAAT